MNSLRRLCCHWIVFCVLYDDVETEPFMARSHNCYKWLLALSCPSVRPHRTTRPPSTDFDEVWYFGFFFSKICRENSSFIKIRQEWRVLYMKTFSHFWQYLAEFYLAWEMFQTEVVQNIKAHIFMFSNSPPPPENRAVYEIMWKNVEPEGPKMTSQYGAYALHAG
jgi:hypothetical protein